MTKVVFVTSSQIEKQCFASITDFSTMVGNPSKVQDQGPYLESLLKTPDATHLVILHGAAFFTPEALIKCLQHDIGQSNLVCSVAPSYGADPNIQHMIGAVQSGRMKTVEDLKAVSRHYLLPEMKTKEILEGGFVNLRSKTTASFFCIPRALVDELCDVLFPGDEETTMRPEDPEALTKALCSPFMVNGTKNFPKGLASFFARCSLFLKRDHYLATDLSLTMGCHFCSNFPPSDLRTFLKVAMGFKEASVVQGAGAGSGALQRIPSSTALQTEEHETAPHEAQDVQTGVEETKSAPSEVKEVPAEAETAPAPRVSFKDDPPRNAVEEPRVHPPPRARSHSAGPRRHRGPPERHAV